MKYRSFLIFILLLCPVTAIDAQSLDFGIHSGKIVKNFPRFPERNYAVLGSLSYSASLNGFKPWHKYYHFPESVVRFIYGDLGNRRELGQLTGLSYGYRFRKSITGKLNATAEAQLGLAYFNKPFDEQLNYDNTAVGGKITALASGEFGLYYQLSNISLFSKISVLHCSSSHYHLPNAGINLPVLTAGIRYQFGNKKSASADTIYALDKRPKINFRVALGLNEQGGTAGPVNGPHYGIYLASLYIYRHYHPVGRWQAGLEAYYNHGSYVYIKSQRFYEDREYLRSSSLLFILGHEYIFGHLGFVTQGGLYLFNPLNNDLYRQLQDKSVKDALRKWFTARLGVQYYLFDTFSKKHNNLFIGCYTKTNFGKADFLELSVGYNF